MIKEIENMRDQFRQAAAGMSFSPEVRAEGRVREFSAELEADLSELGDKAGNYAQKYAEHLRRWAARSARCMSPMITGPANFPAEANRKRMESAQRAWEEFQAWRERYIKRANRVPTKTPEEEIDDAVIRLEKERNAHTLMVEVNKIHRRKVSDEEKRKAFAEEMALSDKLVDKLMVPDYMGRLGFASYALTNSNARIKSLEEKVLIMRKRIERRDDFEPIAFPGGTIDIKYDRVVIKHDEKPGPEAITAIKARGFHWSPKGLCWCRKHTANALRDAKALCGVPL
jgi:hypothetical protein